MYLYTCARRHHYEILKQHIQISPFQHSSCLTNYIRQNSSEIGSILYRHTDTLQPISCVRIVEVKILISPFSIAGHCRTRAHQPSAQLSTIPRLREGPYPPFARIDAAENR